MHEMEIRSDLQGVMSAVTEAMFDWDGHLQYKNEEKGVVIFSPTNWSRFPNATLVVDVTEVDELCKVRIHSFLSGALVKYEGKMGKYEREFAGMVSDIVG